MPEWVAGLIVQIPLVSAVVWGFLTRKVRSEGELQDLARAAAEERSRLIEQHARELRDKEAAAVAWKQLYERADEERRANGRELGEQLRTLDMALELVKERRS